MSFPNVFTNTNFGQSLAPTSNPTFNNVTLTGTLTLPAQAQYTVFAGAGTTGLIATLGTVTGGSGYTGAGTYLAVPLTGGTGTGAKATVVVAGGAVTTVTITTVGTGYTVNDTLSASNTNLGGAGSGFSVPVATINAVPVFRSLVIGDLPTTGYILGTSTATTQAAFDNSTKLATTAYVDNVLSSGTEISWADDFLMCNSATVGATGTSWQGDTNWRTSPITGGTTGTIAQPSGNTYQNPGQALLTTTAVSGQGISISRSGNQGSTGVILSTSTGWQYDCWFKLPATITNYCFRAGLVGTGVDVSDPPTSGAWLEYDTANASSQTYLTFRTANGAASNYDTTLTVSPVASTWYHLRILSTAAGTIGYQIGSANGALGALTNVTTDIDASHIMGICVQLIPRTTAAVTLTIDRISWVAKPGRV